MANTAETEQKLMRPSFYKYISALEKLDCDKIEHLIYLLVDCLNRGGTVFTAGNGGSYSIAQHFAADLRGPVIIGGVQHRYDEPRRVVHLGSNLAEFTALINDQGYEDALLYLAKREGMCGGDVAVVFSVSGTSKNTGRLLRECGKMPSYCILFTAAKATTYLCRLLTVETSERDNDWYGVVEGVFSCIAHEIANRVKERLNEQG